MGFDLQLTDEQQALRETLHDFAESVVRPVAREAEEAGQVPDGVARQIHEIGISAPVDEAFGGGGTFDAVTYCIAAEELAWGDPGIAFQALGSGLAAIVIGVAGSDTQKKDLLPRFVDAPPRSFVAIGEKVALGDLESLETTVDGDKVRGHKYAVLNADSADVGVVVGRSGDELAAVLVTEPTSYEVVKPEDKLGLEAARTFVVSFDGAGDAIAPGPELTKAILWAKLLTGTLAIGCARASLEYASNYAIEREAFGKPIGAFQAISFRVADMAIEVDAARLAVWRAAWKIDRGEATFADIAEANGQAVETAIRCGDDGVQILGGHGFIRDHPVEKWYRDSATLSAFDPPELGGDDAVARSVFAGGES